MKLNSLLVRPNLKNKAKRNIVCFSGGKDSQATAIWCANNLGEDFEIVFCDTAWEHRLTYDFIMKFEIEMGKKVNVLKSKKYKVLYEKATSLDPKLKSKKTVRKEVPVNILN